MWLLLHAWKWKFSMLNIELEITFCVVYLDGSACRPLSSWRQENIGMRLSSLFAHRVVVGAIVLRVCSPLVQVPDTYLVLRPMLGSFSPPWHPPDVNQRYSLLYLLVVPSIACPLGHPAIIRRCVSSSHTNEIPGWFGRKVLSYHTQTTDQVTVQK